MRQQNAAHLQENMSLSTEVLGTENNQLNEQKLCACCHL